MADQAEPSSAVFTALDELRSVDPNAWTEGTLFDLALRLDRVAGLQAHLHEVRGWLEITLAERMETDEVRIPGVGMARRGKGTRSTWRYPEAGEQMRDDLAHAVAREVSTDVATGEMDPAKRNVALHALRTAFTAIPSFTSLLKAGRDRLGLRIDEYRNFEDYYTVKLEVGDYEAHR